MQKFPFFKWHGSKILVFHTVFCHFTDEFVNVKLSFIFSNQEKKANFFFILPFRLIPKVQQEHPLQIFFQSEGGPLLKFFFRRLLTLIIACEYFKVGEILPDIRVRVQPIPISICSRLQLFSTRKPIEQIWTQLALIVSTDWQKMSKNWKKEPILMISIFS